MDQILNRPDIRPLSKAGYTKSDRIYNLLVHFFHNSPAIILNGQQNCHFFFSEKQAFQAIKDVSCINYYFSCWANLDNSFDIINVPAVHADQFDVGADLLCQGSAQLRHVSSTIWDRKEYSYKDLRLCSLPCTKRSTGVYIVPFHH